MSVALANQELSVRAVPRRPARPYGILIVDDDKGVRAVLNTWLRHQGYTVWQAQSGPEAIELYTSHRDTIDVVLLDVRMPVMDGPQTLAALLKVDSLVCCCFMSGELGSFSEGKLRDLGAALVLHKPFRLADVARLLWELGAPLGRETAVQAPDRDMTAGFLMDHRENRVGLRRVRMA